MKGPYDSIGAQKSDISLFLEIANDISNFGSALSDWNCHNVKDYGKNSSNPRLDLVFENLKLKNNRWLVIGNLNINSISDKFEN